MTSRGWTDLRYAEAIRLLAARTGLSLRPHSHSTLEQGVRKAMTRARSTDLDAYLESLKTSASALDDLIVELTVGETYFFREPAQFEYIRRQILPDIHSHGRGGRTFRAWSAGCASGEEAYSFAILCAQEGMLDRAHILATDISRAALKTARQAVYPDWSFRGAGAGLAKPYFSPAGDVHRLDDTIRRSVTFEYLNLALDVYPSTVTGTWGLDLILCRNVLIYFDAQTIACVARRLFDSLDAGGWLVTSASDPPLDRLAPFETVATDGGMLYRRAVGEAQRSNDDSVPSTQYPVPSTPYSVLSTQYSAQNVDSPVAGEGIPTADPHGESRRALLQGDLCRAIELTRDNQSDPLACAIHVQALANDDVPAAERACAAAAARHPLSAELNYLHAVLLMEADRDEEAARAARRLLCLDRTLALAHFTLGSILRRVGDASGAERAFRNCRDLCAARPADEHVPLSDGETVGRLLFAAEAQLHSLAAVKEARP